MATPTPGVRVELDGRTRTFRYTNRSLVELEEETGMTILQHSSRVEAVGSNKSSTAIVWAALLHEKPDLSYDDVVDMVDLTRLEELADAAVRAYQIAYGEDPDAEEEPGEEGEAGNG